VSRIKTLVTRVEVDVAIKSHNCQANAQHRIDRGDARLKVRNGRSWDHYCLQCARTIIQRDLLCLKELADRIGGDKHLSLASPRATALAEPPKRACGETATLSPYT
jgi:hypothetical protein